MRLKFFALFALLVFALSQSCIPSIHPLYTKDKIVYLNLLEGIWTDEPGDVQLKKHMTPQGEKKDIEVTIHEDGSDQAEIWDFRKKDDNGYLLIHQDGKGRKAAFEVFVVKLGDDHFMDFFPIDLPKEVGEDAYHKFTNDMATSHLMLVHTFAKLIIINDEIKIEMFDPDFLERLFEQRQIRIKHEELGDGGYVLTAQPEELQKFVEKYADHKEAFIEDMIVLNKAGEGK